MSLEVSRTACRWIVGACIGVVATVAHATTPISIMPIGDSITAGSGVATGGYRAPMATQLAAVGFSPTLLGTQVDSGQPAAYQHHEGHAGWRIDQLAGNLTGYAAVDSTNAGGYWLTGGHSTGRSAVSPNVVTVLGGINDIDGFYENNAGAPSFAVTSSTNPMSAPANTAFILSSLESRMTTLVTTLTTTLPNAAIMLCSTIPYANSFLDSTVTGASDAQRAIWATQDGVNAGQEYGVNHYVILFDSWMKNTFIPQEQAAHFNVNYVDLYSDFILPDGTVRGWGASTTGPNGYSDYGLHPNQYGYNLMGATLASSIQAVELPEPTSLAMVALAGAVAMRRRGTRRA